MYSLDICVSYSIIFISSNFHSKAKMHRWHNDPREAPELA